nr:uncharacterized protein LOC109170907 [Ipomoea batatas]GME03998.1 uncharacterized protein LOC109170907 [Ipomoea batatas]
MKWHKERRIDDDEYLRHPADSKAWKDFDKEFPWFANYRIEASTIELSFPGYCISRHQIGPGIISNLLPQHQVGPSPQDKGLLKWRPQ